MTGRWRGLAKVACIGGHAGVPRAAETTRRQRGTPIPAVGPGGARKKDEGSHSQGRSEKTRFVMPWASVGGQPRKSLPCPGDARSQNQCSVPDLNIQEISGIRLSLP